MKRLSPLVLLLLLQTDLPAADTPRAFTLEQVLSAPFPTDLVAAPAASDSTSGSVAWVFDAKGARNVWVAVPPDYKGRAVTAYPDDDGQEISEVAFTPDGKSVAFVRGGPPNRASEVPNPLSDPAGSTQAVFIVSVSAGAGGAPKRVGDGAGLAISPRGDRIAWVQKDKVWWAPLDGAATPGAAAQAFQARGNCRNLRWSPDGARLAFVSRRGDHAFIGVFDPAGKNVRYLDPSVDQDSEPAWSPDGKRIAFLRIPSSPSAREILRPHREGTPWSILVADAGTGRAKPVFRADAGKGSVFREVVSRDQILWTDTGAGGGRLVFPWEKDGWTHLYALPSEGGAPALLTPGAFEVEDVALAPDGKSLLYNSNEGDIERRHIWRVALAAAGGKPIAVTSGEGSEWSPVAAGGDAIAFIRSGAKKHPYPVIRSGGASGAEKELAPGSVPAEYP
ncbi:MAG TPA: DPP IV N-terminal domain-containing protein, partial [Thermoanaerobaculia bacterium]